MYKHILIATDGSDLAQKAVGQGLSLARALDAKAIVVMVTEPLRTVASGELMVAFPADEYEKTAAASAAKVLASAVDVARKVGIQTETLHVKEQLPAEGIVETAKRVGADLIVMASHGRRGLSRMLLGSQAAKVVQLSEVPVLICR
ncbi:MAG TPA: universal stress protein [Hyphomicrobiaceae bacterium]|nr:universal stress protein [Hyphomicrobiaceae bacterium]